MPDQNKKSYNLNELSNKDNRYSEDEDTYGIFKQKLEVDTDVNEDPNREALLDQSVDGYIKANEKK